jgi:hypothetical protein
MFTTKKIYSLFPFALTKRESFLDILWKNLLGRINQQETKKFLGSSETLRKELFTNKFSNNFEQKNNFFNDLIKTLPEHFSKKHIDIDFLEWFIGFSEGDGCFLIKENRPCFVINQADIQVLYFIRTKIGFGVVQPFKQEGRIYARYTVTNVEGIRHLISIFNGNIHLEKVHTRFTKWVTKYNVVFQDNIIVKTCRNANQITLNSSWITGFFDAEGGFSSNVAIRKEKYERLYVRTYVDQKFEFEILNQIATLFEVKSVTVRNKNKFLYRVEINSKESLKIAINYFTTFKLRTRKNKAFAIWLKIANLYVTGEHLSRLETIRKKTERLKEINDDFKRIKSVLVLLKKELE